MEGNRANKIFTEMLTEQGFENLLTYQHIGYHWERPDFFNEGDSLYCHFQLDATASVPGFMAECCYSHISVRFTCFPHYRMNLLQVRYGIKSKGRIYGGYEMGKRRSGKCRYSLS